MSSRREQKAALRRERERREEEAKQAAARNHRRHQAAIAAIFVIGIGLVAFAVATGDGGTKPQANHERMDHSSQMNNPPAPGSRAPGFSVLDVTSGKRLTLGDLRGDKALLFFSEGVNCQACMVQAANLERSAQLRRRGIRLISVTTDSPGVLRQAAGEYGIETPLLADESREMMGDWGQLGYGGMGHPDTGGHSFVLVGADGKVLWESSYAEMYVPTSKLLEDMDA